MASRVVRGALQSGAYNYINEFLNICICMHTDAYPLIQAGGEGGTACLVQWLRASCVARQIHT